MLSTDKDLRDPEWVDPPHGVNEIYEVFGDPDDLESVSMRDDADKGLVTIDLPFALSLSWSAEEVQRMTCHKLVAPAFASVFGHLEYCSAQDLIQDYGGCYNNRPIRGSDKKSTHAWGISIDLNVACNELGEIGHQPAFLVEVFLAHGFHWGGNFRGRKDYQHFQYCTGY